MQRRHRVLAVSAVCFVLIAFSATSVNAFTFLKVHLQGPNVPPPNIHNVRVTLVAPFGPLFPTEFLKPGDTTPDPGRFLSNGEWLIVVFDLDDQKLIAAESFTVTANTPPTIHGLIWRNVSGELKFSWGSFKRAKSYDEAAGGPEPAKEQ